MEPHLNKFLVETLFQLNDFIFIPSSLPSLNQTGHLAYEPIYA